MTTPAPPVRKIVVVGGGSAGFLAAVTLKRKFSSLEVLLVRSPKIGIIGVGEGTTYPVPRHLHLFLGIPHAELFAKARPTWKLGIRFHWGSRPHFNYTFGRQLDCRWPELSRNHGFYCDSDFSRLDLASAMMDAGTAFPIASDGQPTIPDVAAYHFENKLFVKFLESYAIDLGIVIRDADVEQVSLNDAGLESLSLETGEQIQGDLFVDASGFKSLLLSQCLKEPFTDYRAALFCDRAIVGGWHRKHEPILPYTIAETMEAGWSWQIEHEQRINRGYVYSSAFISDDAAEQEFRAKNPKLGAVRIVQFPSGRHNRFWVKNVVAIGNSAGFVEPLEATSLAMICDEARLLAESLFDSQFVPNDTQRSAYNSVIANKWDEIRDFLGVHYKFNTRLNTEFWQACRNDVQIGNAVPIVEFYRQNGPTPFGRHVLPDSIFGLEGYYVLLLGQQVPYQKQSNPPPHELAQFRARQKQLGSIASSAMSIRSLLNKLQDPGWLPHLENPPPFSSIIPANTTY